MSKTSGADRQRYWREVIARQRASGQSIVGFCVQEGLAPASFHAWKRRFQQRRSNNDQSAGEEALVPVQIVADPTGGVGSLEVQWPGGVVLRMQGFDARAVGAVVAALSTAVTPRTAEC